MSQQVLQRPTLVLNRSWQPIHVSTVARALIMLYGGTIRVVDPRDYQTYSWSDWSELRPRDGEHAVRSASLCLRVPEVVVLATYDGMPGRTVPFSRRNIFRRDHHACQYCGAQPRVDELTIDHVIPRAQGGVSSWDNCVLACFECNRRKADRTPEQAHMRLRRMPKQPHWRPIYAWHSKPIKSWERFLGEAYWNVPLEDQ